MSEEKNITLVLGASEHPERYSYLAVKKLRQAGKQVVALGNRPGHIGDTEIITGKPPLNNIDTVTLYLNPLRQKDYYDYILSLNPQRIIFNPGAENPELEALAREHHIQPQVACTLVLLATKQYDKYRVQ